ncbi:hypothetical protein NLJ89_g1754 [Agrocybe chaxingu]|uniref:Uncharacterized protein n=1 Tax=Agrocybe chaxingu TaxID=84603 RepID=A0A9W8TCX4_9AGAR|nr:hypothetical protein NLJ89_g1754 [Agrocybe chaxingu]
MTSATLSVAICHAVLGSKAHWALYLSVKEGITRREVIYQATGPENQLHLEIRENLDPRSSERLNCLVHVSELISKEDVDQAEALIRQQEIKNNITRWTCQDWVLEVLEALDDEELLDEYEYAEARSELLDKFAN